MQRLTMTLRDPDPSPTLFPSSSTTSTTTLLNSLALSNPLSGTMNSLNLQQPSPFTSHQLHASFLAQSQFNASRTNGRTKDNKTTTTSQSNQNLTDTPIDLSALPPPSKRLKLEKEDVNDDDDDADDDSSIESANHHHHHRTQADFCEVIRQQQQQQLPINEDVTATTIATSTTITTTTTGMAKMATTTQIFKQERELSLSPSSTPPPQPESTDQRSKAEEEIALWTVNQVCDFVASIDICVEYEQNFKDQCIDGTSLLMLSEVHLTGSLGMKLGPALKLKSMLAKRVNELR